MDSAKGRTKRARRTAKKENPKPVLKGHLSFCTVHLSALIFQKFYGELNLHTTHSPRDRPQDVRPVLRLVSNTLALRLLVLMLLLILLKCKHFAFIFCMLSSSSRRRHNLIMRPTINELLRQLDERSSISAEPNRAGCQSLIVRLSACCCCSPYPIDNDTTSSNHCSLVHLRPQSAWVELDRPTDPPTTVDDRGRGRASQNHSPGLRYLWRTRSHK